MKLKFKSEDFELDTDQSEEGLVICVDDTNLKDKTIEPGQELEGEIYVNYIVENYTSDTLGAMELPNIPIKIKVVDNKVEGQISLAYLESFEQSDISVDEWDYDYWDGDFDSAEEVLFEMYEESLDNFKKKLEDNLNVIFSIVED